MAASNSTASATFSSKPLITNTSGTISTCQPVSFEARRAGDSFDFNRPVIDLGDFELKQFDHKPWIGAGQDDLRPMRPLLNGFDIATNALAHLIFLSRHTLPVGQQRLVFAQVHDHVGTVETAHRAADNISHTVFEFAENQLLFGAANVL